MWLCEGKLKVKTSHFWLPSASQKRACLSSLLSEGHTDVAEHFPKLCEDNRRLPKTLRKTRRCSDDTPTTIYETNLVSVHSSMSSLVCVENTPRNPGCGLVRILRVVYFPEYFTERIKNLCALWNSITRGSFGTQAELLTGL